MDRQSVLVEVGTKLLWNNGRYTEAHVVEVTRIAKDGKSLWVAIPGVEKDVRFSCRYVDWGNDKGRSMVDNYGDDEWGTSTHRHSATIRPLLPNETEESLAAAAQARKDAETAKKEAEQAKRDADHNATLAAMLEVNETRITKLVYPLIDDLRTVVIVDKHGNEQRVIFSVGEKEELDWHTLKAVKKVALTFVRYGTDDWHRDHKRFETSSNEAVGDTLQEALIDLALRIWD